MSTKAIPNLIPQTPELDAPAETTSPADILRAQAEYWTERLKGEVVGEVERTLTAPERVGYWFCFVIPWLEGYQEYRYRLFLVEHGLAFYPLWVSSRRDDPSPVEVKDEEGFFAELGRRFSAAETLRAVRQLRAVAAEAKEEEVTEKRRAG